MYLTIKNFILLLTVYTGSTGCHIMNMKQAKFKNSYVTKGYIKSTNIHNFTMLWTESIADIEKERFKLLTVYTGSTGCDLMVMKQAKFKN